MPTFQTKKFIEAQTAKGRSPEEISSFLQKKGFDPSKESQMFKTGATGMAMGAGKSFLQGTQAVARGLQTAGQGILAFLDPTKTYSQVREKTGFKSLKPETPEGASVVEATTPRGPAEQMGAKAETVAEFVVPGGVALKGSKLATGVPKVLKTTAGATARGTAKVAGKTAETAGEVALGTKNVRAVEQAFKAPKDVAAFRTGKASMQTVADRVNEGIDTVRGVSKQKFDDVIAKLPGNKVSKSSTIERMRSDIVENLGIDGKKLSLNNLLDSGMSNDEARVVLRLFNRVKAHGDWTDKGVIKLRQAIDKGGFYKNSDDFKSSNKIVGRIRRILNESASQGLGDDTLKNALKEASDDIELIEQMGYTLRGTNVERNVEATAKRLESLLTQLDDPTKREATKKLLTQLQERTGLNAEELLRSLSAARQAGKDIPEGDVIAGIRSLVTRGVERASEMGGRAVGNQPESQLFNRVAPPQPFRTGELPPIPRAGGSKKKFNEAIEARRKAAFDEIIKRRAR